MVPPLMISPPYQPLFVLALYRRIAIWERRPIISIVLGAVWLTNVAFLIHGAHLSLLICYNALTPRRPLGIAIVRKRCLYLTTTRRLIEDLVERRLASIAECLLRCRFSEDEAQRARVDRDRLDTSYRHDYWCPPITIGHFNLAYALSPRVSSVCNRAPRSFP